MRSPDSPRSHFSVVWRRFKRRQSLSAEPGDAVQVLQDTVAGYSVLGCLHWGPLPFQSTKAYEEQLGNDP